MLLNIAVLDPAAAATDPAFAGSLQLIATHMPQGMDEKKITPKICSFVVWLELTHTGSEMLLLLGRYIFDLQEHTTHTHTFAESLQLIATHMPQGMDAVCFFSRPKSVALLFG